MLSRRDDLIAMTYSMLQLSMGNLPWSGDCQELENASKPKPIIEKIRKMKMELNCEKFSVTRDYNLVSLVKYLEKYDFY